jgi:8-oxo-dGTP diphosphatase
MDWALKRLGAAAAIFNTRGEVLLVRHTYGALNWELPGGASEPDESAEETAVREVREETGMEVVPELLTGIYYERELDAHHFVFRCRTSGDAVPTASSEEIAECDYWPAHALPRPLSDFTVLRIKEAAADERAMTVVEISPRTWLS